VIVSITLLHAGSDPVRFAALVWPAEFATMATMR
jgi:hypothetical protein